jgi:ATP-dependent Clp protease adaptor protein ClpS|tara:strand:- start:547 stop:843 length:297 start_codon:yes stop_codon:yes gene_type:complete
MARSKTKTITKTELKYPDRFNVIILNDDYTPMDFVIKLLIEVFNKTIEQAQDITMEIHNSGKGIAGSYNLEIGEQKVSEVTLISRHHGHPLKSLLEKI